MKEYLAWVTTMLHAPVKKRWEWVELIFAGFRTYRKSKEGIYLSDILQDKDTWEILGFCPNIQYVRVDHKDEEMLKYIFVHPWGTPPLLLRHKRLDIAVIAGPGMRWNDTILREIKDNKIIDHNEGWHG